MVVKSVSLPLACRKHQAITERTALIIEDTWRRRGGHCLGKGRQNAALAKTAEILDIWPPDYIIFKHKKIAAFLKMGICNEPFVQQVSLRLSSLK